VRLAVLAIALVLAGCPRAPKPVPLGGEWPATAGKYDSTTKAWTRRGQIRAEYQQVAEVFATFKSPAWRSAWVARRAKRGKLSDAARAELLEAERAAEAAAWEVQIVLTTWDRKENDLDRGDRSVWRVVLVDADGNEIAPTEIKRDRRPANIIRSEFPGFTDFSEAYMVKFPRDARVLGPGVEKIGLRVSSTRGGIELWWKAP
jgi:hypothetical protein